MNEEQEAILRADFERLENDSSKFARSRKGTYVNPAVARDWKWFQLGAIAREHLETGRGPEGPLIMR